MIKCISSVIGFFLVVSQFVGCKSEDTPTPIVPFLTINVASGFVPPADSWIFVTDESNVVVDARQFSGPGTFSLEGPMKEGETFTLHRLSVNGSGNGKTFLVNSVAGVKFGTMWHILPPPQHEGIVTTPTAAVAIENFAGSPNRWTISGPDGGVIQNGELAGSTLNATFTVKQTSDFVISCLYGSTCHYEILHNVAANTSRSIVLKPMDKLVTIDIPQNKYPFLQVAGFYPGDNTSLAGYINASVNGDPGSSSVAIGYADGFEKYRTRIIFQDGIDLAIYEKFGTPIDTQPTFASPDITVTAAKVINLSASLSIPFHEAGLAFSGPASNFSSIYWTATIGGDGATGDLDFKVQELPSEITAMYPEFTIDKVYLVSVSATQYKDDFRYEDKLAANDPSYTGQRTSNEFFLYTLN